MPVDHAVTAGTTTPPVDEFATASRASILSGSIATSHARISGDVDACKVQTTHFDPTRLTSWKLNGIVESTSLEFEDATWERQDDDDDDKDEWCWWERSAGLLLVDVKSWHFDM